MFPKINRIEKGKSVKNGLLGLLRVNPAVLEKRHNPFWNVKAASRTYFGLRLIPQISQMASAISRINHQR